VHPAARAIRRDPRVALLAGGCLVRDRAALDVDLTSRTFDERVRSQELRKYPRQAATGVTPEAEIRKPLPFAVPVTPVAADAQRNGPTPVAVL
jgi:hypothetical protein